MAALQEEVFGAEAAGSLSCVYSGVFWQWHCTEKNYSSLLNNEIASLKNNYKIKC